MILIISPNHNDYHNDNVGSKFKMSSRNY